ncbi:MAG: cell division protein FtsL [Roseovarius sp.]|nr:cell division protein FtsL [Roseovarius sp.]
MRNLFFLSLFILVLGLAHWAYQENYKTQKARERAESVQRQISLARDRLRILNAEWAYLNRPERLKALISMTHKNPGLYPLIAESYGEIKDVPFHKGKIFMAQNANIDNGGEFP